MIQRTLLHPHLWVRFLSLLLLGMVVFIASWSLSYTFLPEGILRGKLGAAVLAGDSAAPTFWLEFARIFGLNFAIASICVAAVSLIRTELGIPFGYYSPLLWAILYGALLGSNSFTFPMPQRLAPTLAVLGRSGPYELVAYLLTATALYNISRLALRGRWPRQTAEEVIPSSLTREQWVGMILAVLILLISNAYEAYRVLQVG